MSCSVELSMKSFITWVFLISVKLPTEEQLKQIKGAKKSQNKE